MATKQSTYEWKGVEAVESSCLFRSGRQFLVYSGSASHLRRLLKSLDRNQGFRVLEQSAKACGSIVSSSWLEDIGHNELEDVHRPRDCGFNLGMKSGSAAATSVTSKVR